VVERIAHRGSGKPRVEEPTPVTAGGDR
jgi:hypothetical protein